MLAIERLEPSQTLGGEHEVGPILRELSENGLVVRARIGVKFVDQERDLPPVLGRERPAFLTWMALSWQARGGVVARQLQRRREFLLKELRREKETLESVLKEVGHAYHEAVWMISLMSAEFETELKWIAKVEKEMKLRGKAKHPEYVER